MQNLIKLILRFHLLLIFLALQVFAFVLIVNFNNYQKAMFITSSNKLTGDLYSHISVFTEVLETRRQNDKLAQTNANLKNYIIHSSSQERENPASFIDTLTGKYYTLIPSRIVNNTRNKFQNYLTINKGSNDGVKLGMGVISDDGVVGIVKGSSANFSVVIPIINSLLTISAKVGKKGNFGSLVWDGLDPRFATLKDIEQHAVVEVGDKVITSGYGTAFPEGITVGTVEEIRLTEDGFFYLIDVRLATKFRNLYHVDILRNSSIDEIRYLESREAHE